MVGQPTIEEFEEWMTPRQALNFLAPYFSDFNLVPSAIMGRLQGGAVQAAALSSDISKEISPVLISAVLWSYLSVRGPDWWDTGDIKVYRTGNQHRATVDGWFFGINFEKTGVEAIAKGRSKIVKPAATPKTEAPATKAPPPITAPSRAGRPRKEFWDDLIIATMKAIWDGDLQPQTYADVERWMLTWASDHDHKLSDTAVKEPAKKVFAAHQS